jgi:carbamoyl-phosphate synthase large subunit
LKEIASVRLKPNILISSAGRRSGLIQAMRNSLALKRPHAKIIAADALLSAPARFLADRFHQVPQCRNPSFIPRLLEICLKEEVGLVIPTIDTELAVLTENRELFAVSGVVVAVSGSHTVSIAADKQLTHAWLTTNGIPAPRQASIPQVLYKPADWKWPMIIKPRWGSASVGVRRVATSAELAAVAGDVHGLVVQEIASGKEFTVNLYVSRSGKCVCAVPHWRMEVRAGEVSKGVTVKNESLMALAKRAAESLPDALGPLNLQCFLDADGTVTVIELNARFGGGFPLAHAAGARFTDWLLDEQEGKELEPFDAWRDNLAMLRYDEAVYLPGDAI